SAIGSLMLMESSFSYTLIRSDCSSGVYSKFGLGRSKLREAVMRGDVPGMVKASW
ncbi:MAG: hypothetical protein EBW74_11370, partial [Betaproteobacteria bacterium]|nr:hypothetical protein [Betaproteobacteria bacterium]